MRERSITTKNGVVFYWVSEDFDAEKDTIFFFPGLTADHTIFIPQCEYFERNYNCITWDTPTHGKSRPYKEFSFNNTTQVILKILETEQVNHIIAVGQSFGGYCVQALLARYPEKVQAFIGIGTTPYGKMYYSRSDIFWLKQTGRIGMCFPFGMLKKAAAKGAAWTKQGYDNMIAMLAPYSKKEYCSLLQTAYDAFLEDNHDIEISCPVLITYGEHDTAGKVRRYCSAWHKKTGFPLAVIPNAGHNANVDNPEEMNLCIEKFLRAKKD